MLFCSFLKSKLSGIFPSNVQSMMCLGLEGLGFLYCMAAVFSNNNQDFVRVNDFNTLYDSLASFV